MTDKIEGQFVKLDERLTRLESIMASLLERIDHQRLEASHASDQIKEWVTQFVVMRLQQLVPEVYVGKSIDSQQSQIGDVCACWPCDDMVSDLVKVRV